MPIEKRALPYFKYHPEPIKQVLLSQMIPLYVIVVERKLIFTTKGLFLVLMILKHFVLGVSQMALPVKNLKVIFKISPLLKEHYQPMTVTVNIQVINQVYLKKILKS